MRAPKARLYGTHSSLHDRAGTFASIYIIHGNIRSNFSFHSYIVVVCDHTIT